MWHIVRMSNFVYIIKHHFGSTTEYDSLFIFKANIHTLCIMENETFSKIYNIQLFLYLIGLQLPRY